MTVGQKIQLTFKRSADNFVPCSDGTTILTTVATAWDNRNKRTITTIIGRTKLWEWPYSAKELVSMGMFYHVERS